VEKVIIKQKLQLLVLKNSHYDTWGWKCKYSYMHNIQSRSQLNNNRIWGNAGEV